MSSGSFVFFIQIVHNSPRSTLFPYTTLFRSRENIDAHIPKQSPPPLHQGATADAPRLPRCTARGWRTTLHVEELDRKSTRLNSSHGYISYAVFCLKKKKKPAEQRPKPGDRPR